MEKLPVISSSSGTGSAAACSFFAPHCHYQQTPLCIPDEVWILHLSPFLTPPDYINFMIGACNLLPHEFNLKRCIGGKDWDVERAWKTAVYSSFLRHQKPRIIISIMLYRPDRDPSRIDKQWEFTLSWASNFGHAEVVRLLLADSRVDPAANENEAIRYASRYGHHEVVRLLLADSRVDPAAIGNQAFQNASVNGRIDVASSSER